MLTLRAAAILLAACDSLDRTRELLSHLGFGPTLPVGDALRRDFALDACIGTAELLPGAGALRALCVEVHQGADAPTVMTALNRRLVATAPHVLWLVAGVQHAPPRLVLSVMPADRTGANTLLVDRDGVVDSDAETFASLAAVVSASAADLVVHERWAALLGREALNRRFYRALERGVFRLAEDASGGRTAADRDEVALLCSSRLLFLSFLQAKGWLDADRGFLARVFDERMVAGGAFHRRTLLPLFFGTLNVPVRSRAPVARAFGAVPFLNGGLFAPARVERGARAPALSDAALGAFLHEVLGRYRFTAHEERATFSEAAVDPEMLGRAFESLMASRARKASGTFFTPSGLVTRLTDEALLGALERAAPAACRDSIAALASDSAPPPDACDPLRAAIGAIAVLDPACGSGGLLVHALERLARWQQLTGDVRSPDAVRRELLARCIFGVDRDPTAVWLCELRLWLSVAVECEEADPRRVLPLPNLDRNIRVGDALMAPLANPGATIALGLSDARRVAELRATYARATGSRKQGAARALDRAERRAAVAQVDRELAVITHHRRDLMAARRSRDLFGQRGDTIAQGRQAAALRARSTVLRRERRRLLDGGGIPFRYEAHFADVMARGGFDAIIGNPPWVRLHRIPPAERTALRERYWVLRHAAWVPGARAGGAGAGFAGQADLASLFVERSLALLRPRGVLALLVPSKLWTALAGGGVRRLMHREARVLSLEDCSEAEELFDAVTYPSIIVAERREVVRPELVEGMSACDAMREEPARATTFAIHRMQRVIRWQGAQESVAFEGSAGSPWLVVPPAVRAGVDRMQRDTIPLGSMSHGRPVMGVKCGHNDAYLVRCDSSSSGDPREEALRVYDRSGRSGHVEASLLRPILRGERVRPWRMAPGDERIIWTHDEAGPLRKLPPRARQWLDPHRARLAARTDAHGGQPWWALHRVESALGDRARVVWADLARVPRALWLPPGDPSVPLNTCYVLRCGAVADAQAIATLLNSPLAAAWLRSIAEPARGGYRRLFAWTVALLPMPADWERARGILAPLAAAGAAAADTGAPGPTATELLDAALAAYRIRRSDVEALLEWHHLPAS